MSAVIATPAVFGLLSGLSQTTEILNTEGKVIGYYTPAAEYERQRYERAMQSIDFEEVDRRAASNGPYYTTEQVIAHLRSLEST